MEIFFENWTSNNLKRILGPKFFKITPFCGLIPTYLLKKVQTFTTSVTIPAT